MAIVQRATRRTRRGAFLLPLLLLCVFLPWTDALAVEDDPESLAGTPPVLYDASYEPDIDPWHKVRLSDGDTYDVGTAEKNTTVYIDRPGTYYLKGQSHYCRVVIQSGGVDVYLKDGLNLDPNIYAYVGSSTAAITVEEQGGTVRLISEKNANVSLGGYYYCPAVRKEGLKTKLIFETEDPSAPGTVTCYRSPASGAAGIGNAPKAINVGDATGNIEFKSGNIIATGGTDAAGIGSSVGGGGAAYLTFSGASVTATGRGDGAGIGGGYNGNAADILISGGTVNATSTGAGAGIGGGAAGSSLTGKVYTITVSGGTVNASSHSGSGIGSGTEGSVEHIVISGGTVTATSESGTGIGGTGSNFHGRCALTDISGGTVTAVSHASNGVGIGSATCGESGDTVINISGGRVSATGGSSGYSIGGGGKGALQDKGHCTVSISGGTITTDPITDGRIGSKYDLTCTITGGSFRGSVDGSVKDGSGTPVVLMNVDLHGCSAGTAVTDAVISAPSSGYGMKDVITLEGLSSPADSYSIVYPWLQKGTVTTVMDTGSVRYYGTARTDEGQGDLYRASTVILSANASGTGVTDGTAWAVKGETAARDVTHATRPGYTLKGYAPMRSSRKIVLNTDGSFGADVVEFTDADGKWLRTDTPLTFYALWEGEPFTVRFDGNRPAGASTALTGSMAGQTIYPDEAQQLTPNAFALDGYSFLCWNTAPDGSGTSFFDGADAGSLAGLGSTVTLYAQWKPVTYSVRFDGNGAASLMPPQTLSFDKAEKLAKNELFLLGEAFTGWNTLPDGSGTAYADGETVLNLASVQDASVTLYAQWSYTFYTVEYRPNGASGESFRRDIAVGVQTAVENNPFTRKGYSFSGWSTKPDGGAVYHPGDSFTDLAPAGSTVVLYARWSAVPHTGDSDAPFVWAALALAAGTALILSRRRRSAR